jgi:hypothetical protein
MICGHLPLQLPFRQRWIRDRAVESLNCELSAARPRGIGPGADPHRPPPHGLLASYQPPSSARKPWRLDVTVSQTHSPNRYRVRSQRFGQPASCIRYRQPEFRAQRLGPRQERGASGSRLTGSDASDKGEQSPGGHGSVTMRRRTRWVNVVGGRRFHCRILNRCRGVLLLSGIMVVVGASFS